jgi:hypothetical protein
MGQVTQYRETGAKMAHTVANGFEATFHLPGRDVTAVADGQKSTGVIGATRNHTAQYTSLRHFCSNPRGESDYPPFRIDPAMHAHVQGGKLKAWKDEGRTEGGAAK